MPRKLTLLLLVPIAFSWTMTPAWGQRPLAPGVLKVIPAEIDQRDAHSLPMSVPGLVAPSYIPEVFPETDTLHASTRQVVMFRDVYQYEFAFLPLRQIKVNAINTAGDNRQVNVWFLPFRVRDVGATITHESFQDPKFGFTDSEPKAGVDQLDANVLHKRFFGNFVLTGWVQTYENGPGGEQVPKYHEVEYQNMTLPQIHAQVAREEDPEQEYFDCVQLAQQILEKYPAESDQGGKWGIAIWYNVDPRLDYVSVKVSGLTNAFRLEHLPDNNIRVKQRILQLNFWRPGDAIDQHEDRIIYGIPLTDDKNEQALIARRYRLPGPVIRGESTNMETLRTTILFETDAELDPESLDSAVATQLDNGVIPDTVQEGFKNSGTPLGGNASIQTDVKGYRWTIRDNWEGQDREFSIRLHPEYWEKTVDGNIRLTKRLDHLWVYE